MGTELACTPTASNLNSPAQACHHLVLAHDQGEGTANVHDRVMLSREQATLLQLKIAQNVDSADLCSNNNDLQSSPLLAPLLHLGVHIGATVPLRPLIHSRGWLLTSCAVCSTLPCCCTPAHHSL
jgi:hypothetical protein